MKQNFIPELGITETEYDDSELGEPMVLKDHDEYHELLMDNRFLRADPADPEQYEKDEFLSVGLYDGEDGKLHRVFLGWVKSPKRSTDAH